MPEEIRPRTAFYGPVDEVPAHATSPAPPQPHVDVHELKPQSETPPTHVAGTVLPYLVALLASAIGTAVGGMLLKGNDLAIVIGAPIGAAMIMLSYLLPNGPLRRLSGGRWPMIATVVTALVIPAAVILLRNEQGMGYTLAIAAAASLSCAVLIVVAVEVHIQDAISIRALVLLLGAAVVLWGVAFLIDGWSFRAPVMLFGVAVLLMGVAFLIDGWSLMGVALLLMGVEFLLWGVAFLTDDSLLMGVSFLLMGDTLLLWVATALIDGSWLKRVAFLLMGVTLLLVGATFLLGGSSLWGVAVLLVGVGFLFRGFKANSSPGEGKRPLVAAWFGAKE